MIIRFYIIIISIFSTFCSFAQQQYTQNIRGVVLDNQSGYPLIGAVVKVLGSNPIKGGITNNKGEFVIKEVPIGRISIKASYIGYSSAIYQNITLNSGKELYVKIKLVEKLINLKEVVITPDIDKKDAINKMALVSARTFTVEETSKYAGTFGDPARMVRNFAGVGSTGDARNDIIIRGNSPIGVLWKLDGVEIPNPNHFGTLGATGGAISILNNNLLENSDFMTGAFPPEYGDVLSGVFDLNMRSGNKNKYEFWAQFGLNGLEFGTEGPISNDGSFIASGRLSTLEIFEKIGSGLGVGATPQYKDFSFKINLPKVEKFGSTTLFGLVGSSFVEVLQKNKKVGDQSFTPSGFDTRYGSNMGFIGFTHSYFFNKKVRDKVSLVASVNAQDVRIDQIKDNEKKLHYISNLKENKLSLTYDINAKINAKNVLKTGITGNFIIYNYIDSVKVPGNLFKSTTDQNSSTSLWQVYGQWKHRFTENISMTSGIHAMVYALNSSKNIEPRFGLKWQFRKNQSLSFGTGFYSQIQPSIFYFYVDPDIESTVKTNIDLGLSKAFHSVVKYDYNFSKNMRLRVETYYQKLYNIPVSKEYPAFSMLNEGAGFYFNLLDSLENKGSGNNYGVEFTVEKFFSKNYYFLLTASLFESNFKGYDDVSRSTIFNGNYIFNALGGGEYYLDDTKKNIFTYNLKFTLAGGKRYIPIDLEESQAQKKEVLIFEEAYQYKFSDYFRTDVRIGYKRNGKKITQEWALDIQNITNRKNIFQRQFNVNTNSINTEYQIGLLPVVLYRILF